MNSKPVPFGLLQIQFYKFTLDAMELRMKLKDKELDAIKVYNSNSSDEAYLNWLKKNLRCKHQHLISEATGEPTFYLVGKDGKPPHHNTIPYGARGFL
jgi:hypothetical protein